MLRSNSVSFVEVFEFASRLALSPAGAALMHVQIEIKGLEGRHRLSQIVIPNQSRLHERLARLESFLGRGTDGFDRATPRACRGGCTEILRSVRV